LWNIKSLHACLPESETYCRLPGIRQHITLAYVLVQAHVQAQQAAQAQAQANLQAQACSSGGYPLGMPTYSQVSRPWEAEDMLDLPRDASVKVPESCR